MIWLDWKDKEEKEKSSWVLSLEQKLYILYRLFGIKMFCYILVLAASKLLVRRR